MVYVINLFVGKASSIVRVLLVNYPRTWKLRDLAKESGVALGWAFKVSKALIRERLAIRESERAELKLMDPFGLLKRWASYNNFVANTRFVEYYTSEEDFSKFFNLFKSKPRPEYAFTVLSGALLVAPFVRPTNAHIYVKSEEDAKKWADQLNLTPIEENGNVKFAVAEDPNIFYGSVIINGVRVVSDIQLFVDLLNYPARGEEAAEAIYKKIEKRWKEAGFD